MSEKRFTIHKENMYKEDWYDYPFCIKEDGEVVLETIPLYIAEKVRDKLNEQDEKIKELKKENKKLEEEWEFSFRTEMAHHRFAEKELKEKIREKQAKIKELEKVNEDLREVNKENQLLHEENVQQCERWKNLYDIKDAEVTARVDGLNKVCEYYLTEAQFKADTDPNEAVKEVINEILNTEVEM